MSRWVIRRKLHISWIIAIGCIGLFIGIFIAKYFDISNEYNFLYAVVAVFVIIIVFARRYVYLLPFLIVCSVILGLFRGSISQDELANYKPLYGSRIQAIGIVKDDVDSGSTNQIIIRLGAIDIQNKAYPGVLWVTTNTQDIKRGDKIVISGVLNKGFGTFPGVIYRASINKIIHPKPGDIARIVRDWFADTIRTAIPDPQASLGIGYLVGQRRALPADLMSALQLAGLTHIVVASGYNLTVLVRLTRRIFAKISKYLAALSASLMIFAFITITGLSPSMLRAGIVTSLSLAAWYYGRKFHPIVLLSIAVVATVLINPGYAWGDLGWQLSFAAFAGVMILAPLGQRYFFGNKKPGTIAQVLGETISAQIVTAPIIIAAFGQVSNVAIISNLLIMPLVPLAMLLTFVAGIGSIILPEFSLIIGMPATWLLTYMVKITEYFADLPWVTSSINFSSLAVTVSYVFIITACVYMWRKTKYNLRESNLVE